MGNQRIQNAKNIGYFILFLLCLFVAPFLLIISNIGVIAAVKLIAILLLGGVVISGTLFILNWTWNKGIEKFRYDKFQFEGKEVTVHRDLKERSETIAPIYCLSLTALLLAGAYFNLPKLGYLIAVMVLGTFIPVLTHAIIAGGLAPEITIFLTDNESKDGKNEDRVWNYHLIVLWTNSLLMVIVTFIFLLFMKYNGISE